MKSALALFGGPKAVTATVPPWPVLTPEDESVVIDTLRGTGRDVIEAGGAIAALEQAFAEYHGTQHCISTNAGTAALHLAVAVSGVEPGDEVITSPYTWGATVACILHANAIPVFADIEEATLNLDPESVRACLTDRTRAIVVVHIYGVPADMDAIMQIAEEHDLIVIEDCAQAHGAMYKGRKVGSIGHMGCFSFQASKHIPGIEGGAMVTDVEDFYQHAVLMGMHPARQQTQVADEGWRRYVDSTGWNYRIHPLAAALVKNRLGLLDERNRFRNQNVLRFAELVDDIPGVQVLRAPEGSFHTYHMVPIRYDADELGGLPREKFVQAANAEGCGLYSYVYTPLHLRARFQDHYFYGRGCPWTCGHASRMVTYSEGDCPVAEKWAREHELMIFGGGLCGDADKYLSQVANGLRKAAENADAVAQWEPAEEAAS
ncbi:MAG: DegT/DnrJ/EryC1/StrS family aminotransferase [Armatimonadota bacterium]